MENFDSIWDNMTNSYNQLEQIMSAVYQQTQSNPTDENSQSLLQGLGDVAKSMIFSQREFTTAYCDPSMKDVLVSKLDEKKESLEKALGESKGKTM